MDRGRFNLLPFFLLPYRLSDRVWFRMVDGKWGGRGYLVRAVGGWVIPAPPLCPTSRRTRSRAGRVFVV